MDITAPQRKELATKVGIDEQYLYQCLTGRRDMRPAQAVKVESMSKGLVVRSQLRRDWKSVWPDFKAPKAKVKPKSRAREEKAEA